MHPESAVAFIDRHRLIQAVSNLLSNAVRFTSTGGKISLEIFKTETALRVVVTDTGCGIENDQLGRIFERLYQVGNKGDELLGCGLGLGLSIAQEIVALHGGEINAASEPGKGSCFSIVIPDLQVSDASSAD